MRPFLLSLAFFSLVAGAFAQEKAVDVAPLKRWLAQQGNFRSVSADFVQTRRLRVLKDPISRPGHIWFNGPTLFRWELGQPPETIVLRRGKQAFLISPKTKKAKVIDPDAMADKNGMRGMQDMPSMQFPMAMNYDAFEKQFDVLAVKVDGSRCDADILPKDAQAQKFLKRIQLSFDVNTGGLIAFEVATRDGSLLRNEFSNVQLNGAIDRSVFDFDFSGYLVTTDAKP